MRCSQIDVVMNIPVPVNAADGNGVMYTEEAIINACKNADGLPIITRGEDGSETAIGIAKNVSYKDGVIRVEGSIFHSGTCEQVFIDNEKKVIDMKVVSFNLTA